MEERDRKPYVGAMAEAIRRAQAQTAGKTAAKFFSTLIGVAIAAFLIPLLAVYAWNGMTPEGWVDWPYLPTVAGLFVLRIVLNWAKS